jgi:type I restriction enzyme S subunit
MDRRQLPENWKVKTIGSVVTVINGGTPKSEQTEYWNGEIFWITPKDMGKLDNFYVSNTIRKITQLGLERSSAKVIPQNSIILSTRAPIGHLAINQVPMATNQGCRGLIPTSDLDTKLLFYFLKLNIQLLNDLGTGTTFKELSSNSLIKIPVPPLDEQKRIVGILDEAFEGIDQAIRNTEKNLANARELFESYLNKIFTQKGDDWEEKILGTLIKTLTDYHANGSYEILKENVSLLDNDGYAYMVRSTDFENNFENPLKYIDKHAYEFLGKSKVYGGEIIISKIGNAGKVYLMPNINRPCSLAMNLFLLRVDQEKIQSEYLYFFLQSQHGKAQIAERLNGTATKTIRKDGVRSLKILVAPFTLQQEIVKKLDSILFETQQLETIYRQKLAALNELKQSILQKAFTGQLTSKNC